MAQDPKDIVRMFYESYAQGDVGQMLALLHPEVEFRASESFIYADRNPYKGPVAFNGLLKRLTSDWVRFLIIPEEIHGSGDMVIARGRYQGTYKATDEQLDAEFVHVFKFKDEKIVLQHTYTDTAQFRDVVTDSAPAAEAG